MKKIPKLNLLALVLTFLIASMVIPQGAVHAATKPTGKTISNTLKVHYIDVGQADSILIQQGTNAMLIDGGDNYDGQTVTSYLRAQGVTNLSYVIGTHLHDDHIGGLDTVLWNFSVGKVFLPKTTYTNSDLNNLLTPMRLKRLTPTYPTKGSTFSFGGATFTFITPAESKYSSLTDIDGMNNSYLVVKMTYMNNSFLFTGDAQEEAEADMLSSGLNLKADVLKLGHHGSATSTSKAFLDAVQPKSAVATVGREDWCLLPTSPI